MKKTLREPHCRYSCSPVWGNVGVIAVIKLQKFQKTACKNCHQQSVDATALPVILALDEWLIIVREFIDLETQKNELQIP